MLPFLCATRRTGFRVGVEAGATLESFFGADALAE